MPIANDGRNRDHFVPSRRIRIYRFQIRTLPAGLPPGRGLALRLTMAASRHQPALGGGKTMKRIVTATLAAFAALTASAEAADRIKLGFEAGMSGVFGIIGEEMKRGLDLALELHDNKLGGVPVTVYAVDDKADPAQAVQQASKLIDESKIDIITGLMSSNTTVAVRNLYLDAGI